jgi:hypothetical protein
MGFHLTLTGFKDFKKPNSNLEEISFGPDITNDVLMFGSDMDSGDNRSIFHNAMFKSGDEYPNVKMGYKNNVEYKCGFISNKIDCIRNFLIWSKSKTNPFKDFPYFEQSCKKFIRRISSFNYKYFFWDESWIVDYEDSIDFDPWDEAPSSKDIKKMLYILKIMTKFNDDIRHQINPELRTAEYSLGGWFEVKNKKIILTEDAEEFLDESDDYRESIYYGDI